MIDYESKTRTPAYAASKPLTSSLFAKVYGLMAFGLALSGGVAYYVYSSGLFERLMPLFLPIVIVELILVIGLTFGVRKFSASVLFLGFIAYAALNGVTLSTIFLVYKLTLIYKVFFLTAGMFGGLALYGSITDSDLSKIGSICALGLWGLILAAVVNIFLKSSGLDYVISFAGVAIFTGLTMWDAQKIKALAQIENQLDSETKGNLAVSGALILYLDFINLFLSLLRLFGRKR